MRKKILKYIIFIVVILVCVILLSFVLVQLPPVQSWVTNKVTDNLSEQLQRDIQVKSVDIDFFKTVVLQEVFIADQKQDTLLYAEKLASDIGLFSLLKRDIFLNKIELEGATLHLSRSAIDSIYNFDYLLPYFQGSTTDATTTPWGFGVGAVALNRVQIDFQDSVKGNWIKANIGELGGKLNILDFKQKIIDLQEVAVENSIVDYQITRKVKKIPKEEVHAPQTPFSFLDMDWEININQLRLKDNQVLFRDKNKIVEQPDGINFQDIDLSEITLSITDFIWKNNAITATINQLEAQEKSGLEVKEMEAMLQVDNQQLSIDNLWIRTPDSRLKNSTTLTWKDQLYFKTTFDKANIAFHDLNILAPAIKDLQQLNTSIEERIYVDGTVEGNLKNLTIHPIDVRIGEAVELLLEGQVNNINNLDQATFNLQLDRLSTSYQKINQITDSLSLPKELEDFGQFSLSGRIAGQLSDFSFNDLWLTTASNTYIKGHANLVGLPNKDSLRFDLDIDTLTTRADDWAAFFKNKIPPILDSLGNIHFGGTIKGDNHNFLLKGDLQSEIGDLISNAELAFTPDYTSGEYDGDITLIDFDLSRAFPNNKQLGKASLHAKGQGIGFYLNQLVADAQITIDSIDYNEYRYRDVAINGKFDKMNFDGDIQLADENVQLDFKGQMNLKDSIPQFNFALSLDTLNLLPLNFTEKELSFSFDAAIDFTGDKLQNVIGESTITNFKISGPTDHYEEDSILLTASQPRFDSTHFSLRSDFLTADINGNIDLANLPKMVVNYVNDYFPVYDLLTPSFQSELGGFQEQQQDFDYKIIVNDPIPFTLVFLPQLTELEEAYIVGYFDSKAQELNLEAVVDIVRFGGVFSDQVVLNVHGRPEKIGADISLLDVHSGVMASPLAFIDADLRKDDSLRFRLNILGDTLDHRLDARGIIYETENWYEGKLTEDYVLNSRPWKVTANNAIYFWKKNWYVHNLAIQEGTHKIVIQSEEAPWTTTNTPPIKIHYEDFEIADVINFVDLNPDRIKGLINGNLTIKDPVGNIHYLADLEINELFLNQDSIGQLLLDSHLESDQDSIHVYSALNGQENNFSMDGYYHIQERQFALKGKMDSLDLRLLDPFTQRIVSDSKGKVFGNFTVSGSPQNPQLNGNLNLHESSTVIDYLGARVFIPAHKVLVDQGKINLGSFEVEDEDGQKGVISGNIFHQFFKDYDLDLQFQSDAFHVLNTTAEQNPLYHGQVFAAVTADITGQLKVPNIEVKATTLPNTVFNLHPLLESELLTSDDYIIFSSPEEYATGESDTTRYQFRNAFNLNLNIDMEVTPDALVRIIIDPETADQVEGRGRAAMSLGLSRTGQLKVLGDFALEEGQYNFNYQNLVKRNFEIKPNSRVRFNGDPLNAQFDITANYKVKTNTYELIKNETNFASQGEAQAARRRSDIETLLYLTGPLTKPEVNFDIQLANNASTDVSSTFLRKLNELRNDPDEMNKQVFALLLFNSFLATDITGISFSETGQKVALSSVSKMVSNQLNQLATQHVKGLELSFDLSSYESTQDNIISSSVELGLGVSQKLFNDRITLKADADINLSDERPTSGSDIIGDFVLEYELTPKGNYLLRVFHLSEFDVLTDQNTGKTGVGIDYRKSFGNVLKRRKRKKK